MALSHEDLEEGRYSTKTISFRDNRASKFTLMLVRFNADGNECLEDKGYSGQEIMFVSADIGHVEAFYDPRRMASCMGGRGESPLKELLVAVDEGKIPWDKLSDGQGYNPGDLRWLKDER